MIFLIFGIIDLIATIVMLILTCIAPNPTFFIALISLVLNCIFFFSLYGMNKNIKRTEENIFILQDSLNECRKKLRLVPLKREHEENEEFEEENRAKKNECPACFSHIEKGDKECPNCGYQLK